VNAKIVTHQVTDPQMAADFIGIPGGADIVKVFLGDIPLMTHITGPQLAKIAFDQHRYFDMSPLAEAVEQEFGGAQLVLQPATSPYHLKARGHTERFMQERHRYAVDELAKGLDSAIQELVARPTVPYDAFNRAIQSVMNRVFFGGTFPDFLEFLRKLQETVLLLIPAMQVRQAKATGQAVPPEMEAVERMFTEGSEWLKTTAKEAYRRAAREGETKDTLWELFERWNPDQDEKSIASEAFGFGSALLETTPSMLNSSFAILGFDTELQERIRQGAISKNQRVLNDFITLAFCACPAVIASSRMLAHDFDYEGYTLKAGEMVQINLLKANRAMLPGHPEGLNLDYSGLYDYVSQNRETMEGLQLAFGGGEKRCLGIALGTTAVRMLLLSLLPKYKVPKIEPGECQMGGIIMLKVTTPPVQVTPL
jgi:cytochrome P450